MAAVSLFYNTNVATLTSCGNSLTSRKEGKKETRSPISFKNKKRIINNRRKGNSNISIQNSMPCSGFVHECDKFPAIFCHTGHSSLTAV